MLTQQSLKDQLTYDPDTGEFFWKSGRRAGCRRKDGYVVIRVDGELLYAHRLAWLYQYGVQPVQIVDHINGRRDDNRIANLRNATPAVNSQNCRITEKQENLSGYRGVQKNHSGWQAVIWLNRKRKCLGTFASPEQAHQAYLQAKRQMHEGCTL